MKHLVLLLLVVAAVAASIVVLIRPGAQASPDVTITVNSTADTNSRDSVMTLREAMLMATGDLAVTSLSHGECNQVSGVSWNLWCLSPVPIGPDTPETIVFPGSPAIISLGSALPTLDTGSDTIAGSSAVVIVNGVSKTFDCISITSNGNVVKGRQIRNCYAGVTITAGAQNNTIGGTTASDRNVISGNNRGVEILDYNTSGNTVKGNYIGTDAAGTAALGNTYGVVIKAGAEGNTVGGTTAGERNVISGNDEGVFISDDPTSGNTVKGNYIGTDATGTSALGNDWGVSIASIGQTNTVGGTTAAERNVISGNGTGVMISVGSDIVVKGNYIGTDATGTEALPNGRGVSIQTAGDHNTIGGTTAGERNVISGNGTGVEIEGWTRGNTVEGNYIGTDASGSGVLPNEVGVEIWNLAHDNTIGGTTASARNVIAHNTQDGVYVHGDETTGNTIRGNSIHSNGGRGIENHDGGNAELAPPVITGFGSVIGTACLNCTVDIYSDDEDEGRVYEGSTTANGAGNWTFAGSLEGPNITATTTDSSGNTSEFSAPAAVPEPLDSDSDGFTDAVEAYLGTDPLDACRDDPSDDAWPLDMNKDTFITVAGDVFYFRGRIGETGGPPPNANWWVRLDFNMDNFITVAGDVFIYRGMIGATCS